MHAFIVFIFFACTRILFNFSIFTGTNPTVLIIDRAKSINERVLYINTFLLSILILDTSNIRRYSL